MDFITLNNKLSTLVTDSNERRHVLAAVVSQKLSECAPMPTSDVEDVENYYLMQVKSSVLEKMSALNEKLNFDVKIAQDYTRKYWMLRYNTLYPISVVKRKYNSQYGYFDTIMGVGMFIDTTHHEFVNQYKTVIIDLLVDLCNILED